MAFVPWSDDYLEKFIAHANSVCGTAYSFNIKKKNILLDVGFSLKTQKQESFHIGTIRFSKDFANNGKFIIPYTDTNSPLTIKHIYFEYVNKWNWDICDEYCYEDEDWYE